MNAIEEIGLTRDVFDELYDATGGFKGKYNVNQPLRNEDESVYSFIRRGASKLVRDNPDLVDAITEAGTYYGDSED